ncbi:VQ motif-containing protein 20-like [Macadamia integrifolia]|uniref:VQ motif-containing protein 20-like n=1 Tax=Macadamia integrifolia TaxID=60698 RepID=UPI001C4FA8A1|nr:VQ motif-containing protein 20-like [Macadamia integrifolia]
MSSSGESTKRVSPKREIWGRRPRPLYLGVRTDSSKIKKPSADQRRPPPPVVIHIRSPKVIHTEPQDFRALVQHLTGNKASSGSVSTAVVDDFKSKACDIPSIGDAVKNYEVEIFSSSDSVRDPQDNDAERSAPAPLLAPMVPPSWPASPPSVSGTFFLPDSPMTNYPHEWHELGPIP